MKDTIKGFQLSQTQWKMIVNVAQGERTDGLININDFFKILEIISNNMASHQIMNKKKPKNSLYLEYSGFNNNKIGYKTMTNGFYYNRRVLIKIQKISEYCHKSLIILMNIDCLSLKKEKEVDIKPQECRQ